MKKILTSLVALLLAIGAMAIPAQRGIINYTQPDGSVVKLELHGDEFFSWTTLAGTTQVMVLGKDGFWKRSTINPATRAAAKAERERVNKLRAESNRRAAKGPRTHSENPMTHGERHIPVLLVYFSDLDFAVSNPNQAFSNLLNQKGYSANGGTGSVQDFYVDNSHGAFTPVFDVYGPVKLDKEMSYYGADIKDESGQRLGDAHAKDALYDACDKLNASIDFSQYDYDSDGYVDMVLFYYAGYNQAEHGPEDSIWPHQGYGGKNTSYDGKRVSRYFCTSELRSSSGSNMCGIGTTCHEFGHSLGLPDFYDTDYEQNGSCSAVGYFSTMDSGSYNNSGRTPPYFNAEERIFLDWMTEEDIPILPEGDVKILPVLEESCFKSETNTEGEYFLYEFRSGNGWDNPLPEGVVVYHVDKSTIRTVGGITPYEHWYYWDYNNAINAYGAHPCYYVVPSHYQSSLVAKTSETSRWVFPGVEEITSYSPIDWEGNETGVSITQITLDSKRQFATMHVAYNDRSVGGKVVDMNDNPLEGVHVVLTAKENANAPRIQLRRDFKASSGAYEAYTAADGTFNIPLEGFEAEEGHLSFSKQDYKAEAMNVSIGIRGAYVRVQMHRVDQGDLIKFQYYDPWADMYYVGAGYNTVMAAFRIPAEDFPEKGGTLTTVEFYPIWEAKNYYLIVDAGEERILTLPITPTQYGNDLQTLDVSDLEVFVPGGEDVYVGYGIEEATPVSGYDGYLFMCNKGGSNVYLDDLNLETSDWGKSGAYRLCMSASFIEKTESAEPDPEVTDFGKMGVTAIADPGCGVYTSGSKFYLDLVLPSGSVPSATAWKYDGAAASGSVVLTAGTHVVTAAIDWPDGSKETLNLYITVN